MTGEKTKQLKEEVIAVLQISFGYGTGKSDIEVENAADSLMYIFEKQLEQVEREKEEQHNKTKEAIKEHGYSLDNDMVKVILCSLKSQNTQTR